MASRVGIVVPAYRPNPAELAGYLEALAEQFDDARIHVELDEPLAGTLDRLAGTPATVRISERRRGKGAAITAGFEHLDTPVLAFVDADGSTPAHSLATILDPVLAGRAELAVGSRRHPDAEVTVHQSRVRRRLGDLFAAVGRRLLPVELYDYQCGAKAIDRQTWRRIRGTLRCGGFAWDVEVICRVAAAGGTIMEVPISWEDRPGSTVPPARAGIDLGGEVLRAWYRETPLAKRGWHRFLPQVGRERTPLVERPDIVGRDPEGIDL